jgi:predicted transcriptional regulator
VPKKKSGWGLQQVTVEAGALFAKVGLVFSKKEIPKATKSQRRRIRKEVTTDLTRLAEQQNKPRNVIAETFRELAAKERKRAIRRGDWEDAIVASVVEYYAGQN